MTNEEVAIKLSEHDTRIGQIEKQQDDNHRLIVSVEVMATEIKAMKSDIIDVKKDVSELKLEPASRWKSIIGYVLAAIVSSGVTIIIQNIFK